MTFSRIRQNTRRVLDELPDGVELVAACKSRTPEEINEAIRGGAKIIGENYIQEAAEAFSVIGHAAEWHFIGHLQRNKVRKAIGIFDMIETVDSVQLAKEIDKRSREAGKIMPVLVEINSGRERQKFGVFPEDARGLVEEISGLSNIRVRGVMTMGPFSGDPEKARPYFIAAREAFEGIRAAGIEGVEMMYLSMGMTNSYRVAVEEGANIVRVGTKIFGERE